MVTVRVGDQSLSMSYREAHILGRHMAGFDQRTPAQTELAEEAFDSPGVPAGWHSAGLIKMWRA